MSKLPLTLRVDHLPLQPIERPCLPIAIAAIGVDVHVAWPAWVDFGRESDIKVRFGFEPYQFSLAAGRRKGAPLSIDMEIWRGGNCAFGDEPDP